MGESLSKHFVYKSYWLQYHQVELEPVLQIKTSNTFVYKENDSWIRNSIQQRWHSTIFVMLEDSAKKSVPQVIQNELSATYASFGLSPVYMFAEVFFSGEYSMLFSLSMS